MTTSPNRDVDRLIEVAWNAQDSIDWGIDQLAMNDDIDTDESVPLGRIADTAGPLRDALCKFTRYSDNRPIRSAIPIVERVTFIIVWPADPEWARVEYATREAMTWDGDWRLVLDNRLPVDPGQPDRGGYRVWADDRPCAVRIEELPPTQQLRTIR